MTILDQLAAHAKERVEQAKKRISAETIRRQALSFMSPMPESGTVQSFPFEKSDQISMYPGHNSVLRLL